MGILMVPFYAPTKTWYAIDPIISIIRISGIGWSGLVIQMMTSFGTPFW